jgi:hypothetical protein
MKTKAGRKAASRDINGPDLSIQVPKTPEPKTVELLLRTGGAKWCLVAHEANQV